MIQQIKNWSYVSIVVTQYHNKQYSEATVFYLLDYISPFKEFQSAAIEKKKLKMSNNKKKEP